MSAHDSGLRGQAILATLKMGKWEPRVYDREASEAVTRAAGAHVKAARVNKYLLAGAEAEYKRVCTAHSALYNEYYSRTLPFYEGARLLAQAQFFEYRKAMGRRRDALEYELDGLVQAYPALQEQAKGFLGSLYRPEDWPDDIRSRFYVKMGFLPIPDVQDIRMEVSPEALADIREGLQAEVTSAMEAAQEERLGRLYKAVARMAERLSSEGPLYATVVSQVEEAVTCLEETAGVFGPGPLDAIAAEARVALLKHGIEDYKKDGALRTATAATAEDILGTLDRVFGKAAA